MTEREFQRRRIKITRLKCLSYRSISRKQSPTRSCLHDERVSLRKQCERAKSAIDREK